MADDTPRTPWTLAKTPGWAGIPYLQTYGGQSAPYADSGAQILDAFINSGLLPGKPPNPEMGNKAGRYSFGGGGGYGGVYGLLGGGRVATPGGFGPGGGMPQPGPQQPGVPWPGNGTPPKVAVDGPGFTGGGMVGNPGNPMTPTATGNPGDQAGFANQAQGYGRPATPPTAGNEQLAQIAAGVGPQAQAAQQQLFSQLGPMAYAQLMGAIQPQGSGSLLNPSRSAAVSQLMGGMSPQQVASNPLMGAAGGNYYDLAGNSTGLNQGAAPMGSTSPGTSQAYLNTIAGLLGAGR
jgi:hypothetical protein